MTAATDKPSITDEEIREYRGRLFGADYDYDGASPSTPPILRSTTPQSPIACGRRTELASRRRLRP